MAVSVWINTTFVGFHRWKDAPDSVEFLRDYHRHVFHVTVEVGVTHLNRDVEFLTLKKQVDAFIAIRYTNQRFEFSCEQIAEQILKEFNACCVTVSEDGENGARVTKDCPFVPPKNEGTVRTKCFVGTEAEGPRRGFPHLFVPGSITPVELDRVITSLGENLPPYVYYGAGNDRSFNHNTFRRIRKTYEDSSITVEVDSNKTASMVGDKYAVNVVLFLQDSSITEYDAEYVKVVDNKYIRWISIGCIYTTRVDDILFSQDREVE